MLYAGIYIDVVRKAYILQSHIDNKPCYHLYNHRSDLTECQGFIYLAERALQ